jgi:hypothetical protein
MVPQENNAKEKNTKRRQFTTKNSLKNHFFKWLSSNRGLLLTDFF